MSRIIALDYGRKRVGVAVTDVLQLIASGLTTVHSTDIIQFLKDYMDREDVECIVVGEPRQMNNEVSEAEVFINPFIKQLKKTFPGLKIERMDERFTSKIAFRTMLDAGLKKKDRRNKELVDMISATVILQSFLEQS